MKTVLIIIAFLLGTTCSGEMQPSNTPSPNISEPNITDRIGDIESSNPNEVVFNAVVLERFDAKKEVCGLSKGNVALLKVKDVMSHGQGIVNLPYQGQELLVQFPAANGNLPNKDEELFITAIEALCPDATVTRYVVSKHEIIP